tara:strand:+ start:6793 stop:8484 length:1692 start_codon:yes stop_codon:yes gene_type:complete
MKYFKYLSIIILAIASIVSCQEEELNYDSIKWPIPVVTDVSSYNSELSSKITLTGEFKNVDKVSFGNVAGNNLEVAGNSETLTIDIPRTMLVAGAPIVVTNKYSQMYQTIENFVPIIPPTTVSSVTPIQVGLTFKVTGVNVDLLTEVTVNGNPVSVVAKSSEVMTLSVSGLTLTAGMLVDVSFTSLAKNTIEDVEQIDVIYPFIVFGEVILWDFEDGTHQYIGEPTASVLNGDVLGTTENYFSLRAPGYGWEKATGNIASEDVPDVSELINPYLTFALRTPAGSAGYFQLSDQDGHYRHFGFGFDTGGEWLIISEPLDEGWEGEGDFNIGSFKPSLGFKSGNAGENQDVDIAYVKITEGPYDGSQEVGDALAGSTKPAKLVVMDFEDTENWPDLFNGGVLVGSSTLRTNKIEPFFGDEFFTYTDNDVIGSWGSYWGQTISKDMSESQLSVFNDPYLSFAVNGIVGNKQYVIVRMYQYDSQLAMVQKFFPETNGEWKNYQFSLFNKDFENWSEDDTELGAHYKSLTRFNIDAPMDKIEIIIGKAGSDDIGISIDEMVITEGPRF